MSSLTTSSARRRRRRLVLWLGFGIVGLSMGAVWATGFATFNSGTSGALTASPIPIPGAAVEPLNPLASTITANSSPWTVTWTGEWGVTPATEFFKIDLSSLPATQTYNIAMLLTNGAQLDADSNWQDLQLATEMVQKAASSTCTAADFTTPTPATTVVRDFVFDSDDAAVAWNSGDTDVQSDFLLGTNPGIVGGQVYCIGIEAAQEPFTSGTFLRDNGTVPGTYPAFVATVNRAT